MALGSAPLPSVGLLIEADTLPAGQFSLSRSDNQSLYSTRLLYNRKLDCEYGEYALTGQDATLTESTPTAIVAAPLPSLSFFTLGAPTSPVLVAETGYYSLTGRAATMTKAYRLVAEPGTFGAAVAPAQRDMEMNADMGQFYALGVGANLLTNRKTAGDYGEFSLTGFESFGRVEAAGVKVLPAGTGYFSMSRSDNSAIRSTTFVRGYVLTCAYGTFTTSGPDVTLDGPTWRDVADSSGSWVYVTPSGGTWTDVDPDS